MISPPVTTARLATLLKGGIMSAQARSAGVHEPLLITPAGTYSRAPPVFHDTDRATAATRQQFDTYTRVLQQPYGPIHCVAVRDATVVGQGTVITRNGLLLWESAAEFLAHHRDPDGLLKCGDGQWQLLHKHERHIDTPCLLVKRPWFRNFGHWLVDCATLLAILAEDVRRRGWAIVIGTNNDPAMQRIVEETIALLVPEAPLLRHPDHEAWHFTDLRYVMPVHVPPLFKLPLAIERLRTLVLAGQDPAARGAPPWHLSVPSRHRRTKRGQ